MQPGRYATVRPVGRQASKQTCREAGRETGK